MNNKNYEHTIGLKIKEDVVDTKTLMYLKKETLLGVSEIKNKIKEGDYVFLFNATNDKGLYKINAAKNELIKQGINVQLFLDDKEETSTFFDNLENSYRQTTN